MGKTAAREAVQDALLPADLRPDCSACCGLCCVAPAFDAAQGFGYDKPAHISCRNLRPDFRCAIHDRLMEHGFPGCMAFDCYGAGQRITQEIFRGTTWKDSEETAQTMFQLFTRLCVLHELMALLTIAQQRVIEKDVQNKLSAQLQDIDALCRTEAVASGKTEITAIKRKTMGLLRGLESTSVVSTLKSQTRIDS